jgi:hypothetical protein
MKRKLILYLERSFGDDLGRGKSVNSKRRHRRQINVRLRKFVNSIED